MEGNKKVRRTVELGARDYERLTERLKATGTSFSRWVRDRVREWIEAPDDPTPDDPVVGVRLDRKTWERFRLAALFERQSIPEYLADLALRVERQETPSLARLCEENRAKLESAGVESDFISKLAAGYAFDPEEVGFIIQISYILCLESEEAVHLIAEHQKNGIRDSDRSDRLY